MLRIPSHDFMATLHHFLPFSSHTHFFASPTPSSTNRYCQLRRRCSRITAALSNKPRQDPTIVIRRRGYELIGQMLEAAAAANSNASSSDTGPVSSDDQNNLKVPADDTHEGPELNEKDASTLESKRLSLEEKMAEFVDHGKLYVIEDRGSGTDESTEKTKLNNSGSEEGNAERTRNDQDLDREAWKMKNEAEMKHLKSSLNQKKSELRLLMQLVAHEEVCLSILQSKTELERVNTMSLICEAEIGLRALEARLSGVRAVEIEYMGDGETVELAGSFNGWDQHFKMDLVPSSRTETVAESREPRRWKTVLWLYSGVHQIKFIVDGNWTIDGRKATIFEGSTYNNLIRV